ncbi:hypothetical protein SA2016_2669 [Sinomonas atrocyanea]|uniref:Uncharacterized protein n=1 Tax=Sinomonas atrocyanea TaxID=37927 RepID=A0A127A3F4_9MICC|nr:hypothetical protein [Sinomonas atrocyanea]AMM33334.1 hypothetical protein SA2016_2669 [Sinomonas atrocyanea]GEB64926.1 hypothetical protein SAT01_23740 [Sinomonas atrocyanea]GGG73245.1 hypothetical protein GCM10007172_27240 [Sinomonas atrocyanea]
MSQLPASYAKYLEGRSAEFIDTVRPVLLQSAADAVCGVHVVINEPHELQAHLDESVPFGQITEGID